MSITDIGVRKVPSDGVSALDQQGQALLKKALGKLNKEEILNAPKNGTSRLRNYLFCKCIQRIQ